MHAAVKHDRAAIAHGDHNTAPPDILPSSKNHKLYMRRFMSLVHVGDLLASCPALNVAHTAIGSPTVTADPPFESIKNRAE